MRGWRSQVKCEIYLRLSGFLVLISIVFLDLYVNSCGLYTLEAPQKTRPQPQAHRVWYENPWGLDKSRDLPHFPY